MQNKYNVGNEVFICVTTEKQYECTECNGTGEVKCKTYDVECPVCEGMGKINKQTIQPKEA